MYTSITELSAKLNITPQAIRHRMTKIPGFRDNHTTIKKHHLLIDKDGVNILTKSNFSKSNHRIKSNFYQNELLNQLRSDLKHERAENKRLMILLSQSQESTQRLLNDRPASKSKQKGHAKKHGWLWKLLN